VGDIIGAGLEAASKLIPQGARDAVGRGAGAVAEKAAPAVAPVVGAAKKLGEKLPTGWGEQVGDIAAIADYIPAKMIAQKTGKPILDKLGKTKFAKKVDNIVDIAKKPLRNSDGVVDFVPDIPDIDDAASAAKAARAKAPKRGLREKKVSTSEQNLLAIPEAETVTPFDKMMKKAQDAKDHEYEGVLTPLDEAAAEQGNKALQALGKMKNDIGTKKSELIDAANTYLIQTNQFQDTTPIKKKLAELVDKRFGGQFTKGGKIVDAPGDLLRDSAEKGLIQEYATVLDKLGPNATLKQLDGAIMDLRNMVDHKKVSEVKQINTIAEGIGQSLRDDLVKMRDNFIENSVDWGGAEEFIGANGSKRLMKSLRDYANISKIEKRLNSGLSEVVDAQTGQTKRGASLYKSSVMSNTGDARALFRAVKDLTGYDLQREASNAMIAMNAVGDHRAGDLLKELGVVGAIARGDKTGALLKLGQAGGNLVLGDKKKQLLRYYNKAKKGYGVTPEPSRA
jgi:hypothetical protein